MENKKKINWFLPIQYHSGDRGILAAKYLTKINQGLVVTHLILITSPPDGHQFTITVDDYGYGIFAKDWPSVQNIPVPQTIQWQAIVLSPFGQPVPNGNTLYLAATHPTKEEMLKYLEKHPARCLALAEKIYEGTRLVDVVIHPYKECDGASSD